MDITQWIRSRAATGQALNLHAVARERPDLLEIAFGGPTPRGWRRSLIDAGVDPYQIVQTHDDEVECGVCGRALAVLGTHLKKCHAMTGEEYLQEFGADCEISSESFRASHFGGRPIAGIAHWERLWSRHYVIDWVFRLHEEGHDLNFYHVVKTGRPLAISGWTLFGSWDKTLLAAGLDPELLRAIPPHRHWSRSMVIEGLRNLATLKKGNWRQTMSIPLQMAVKRYFRTTQAACLAAGLGFEEINFRAIFQGEPVASLVAAIRTLENLKGKERRTKLDAIYKKNDLNQRIVVGHFGSLCKLAARVGIAPRVVAPEMYRDEADVQHDLDLLEGTGMHLTYSTLKNGHRRLYRVIIDTGWGAERLKPIPRQPTKYPPCNPRSGLLRDRKL